MSFKPEAMMFKILFLSFTIAVTAVPLVVQAEDLYTPEQLEHMQYTFSSFLNGDAHKISQTVNGTLEDQLARKADKLRKIDAAKAVIKSKEDEEGEKLRSASSSFAKMEDDLATARADAASAKKDSNAIKMLNAQNKADALQTKITQQEDAAISKDPDVVAKQAEIKDTQAELKNLEPAIATASKAREQLIEGMRQPQKLAGPPTVGGKGILGKVKPIKIVDDHSFTIDFVAFEVTGEDKNAKAPDGFKSFVGKAHPMRILVTGVDTSKLHVGTETLQDHAVVITGTQQSGKTTVYVVAPDNSDRKAQAMNYLFEALDNLHTPEK